MTSDGFHRDKYRTGEAPLTGSVVYQLVLPDNLHFIAEVADALRSMTSEENWERDGTVLVDEALDAANDMFRSFEPMTLPRNWDCWHEASVGIVGGSLLPIIDGGMIYNTRTSWAVSANGNTFKNRFVLAAGTYSLTILHLTASNSGMLRIKIDGVDIGVLLDFYSATTVRNLYTSMNVTVGDGNHIIEGIVTGKNAASLNYQIWITKMSFMPVGGF